jgi:hypothetical protein
MVPNPEQGAYFDEVIRAAPAEKVRFWNAGNLADLA